jgi:DNA-binding beta-propeller fold protein YncE
MKHMLALLSVVTSLVVTAQSAHAQPHTPRLGIVNTFHVGGAKDWDYPIIDSQSHRLYIACGDHVSIIDTKNGRHVGDVRDLNDAHGIAIVPGKPFGFITSGGENAAAVFDLRSLKVTQKIKMPGSGGKNPDPIIYDPASKKVFALCEGGDAVAIDPDHLDAPPFSIHIGGALEYGRADGAGKIFVNNEDKSEIDVIDTKTMKLVDHWPLAPLEKPSGLAIDARHHRLFAVGENQKMAILDYENGRLLATADIGGGADGCAFDPKLGVALSSNGDDGTATVVAETSPGKFAAVQTLKTAKEGKTIVDDPTASRIYIPAALPTKENKSSDLGVLVLGGAR